MEGSDGDSGLEPGQPGCEDEELSVQHQSFITAISTGGKGRRCKLQMSGNVLYTGVEKHSYL